MKQNMLKKLLAVVLIIMMLFSQAGVCTLFGEEARNEIVLVITGTKVNKELSFTMEQLKQLNEGKVVQYYSSINRVGTKKLQAGEGIKLSYLLKLAGVDSGYGKMTFCASDGFKKEFTEEQISTQRYYYPKILEGSDSNAAKAETVIAFKNAAVTSGAISESMLKDIEGNPSLQLMLGQLSINDVNNSLYVSSLNKIIVGEPIKIEEKTKAVDGKYKHTSYDSAPYNIDAITSATLTVEGPGVEERKITTIRQLETLEQGIHRGIYTEKIDGQVVKNSYEGITVDYLLKNLVKLKASAGQVIFWDKNLQKLGEYSLADIEKADADNNKMIIAYGINGVPLVFDKHDPGYDKTKYNDNGCLKLVLNADQAAVLTSFSAISKIEVKEKDASNVYEHTHSPYNKPEYLYDTVTITGDKIGKEVIYSLKDIENLATAKSKNIGYEGVYSLQNSVNYWNNRVLKGVKLYDLLLLSGLSADMPDHTPIQIIAKDGYNVGPFTLGDIRDASKYGIYIKVMNEPVKTGLPVLLSYGSDGYPFVPLNTSEGFVNGVDNNGGPLRVTFGQKSLEDINGPNQIKYVSKIIVGSDVNYTTHTYGAYESFKDNAINVKVYSHQSNTPIKELTYTIGDLENITLSQKTSTHAMAKGYYATLRGTSYSNEYYQGMDLWYFLKDMVGLSGSEGQVILRSGKKDIARIDMSELSKPNGDYNEYFNVVTQIKNLKPILAYSKNGYPMTSGMASKLGYVGNNGISINGYKKLVKNYDGPLAVILAQSNSRPEGLNAAKVDEIVIRLAPDPCSHAALPYSNYNNTLTIKGDGIKSQTSLKVTELEEMLDYITKANYYVLNKAGTGEGVEYKGISLYDLLTSVTQLQPNAEKVIIVAEDGYSKEFSLQDVMKKDYINEKDNTSNLKMMIAYGKNGKPLVPNKGDIGYDEEASNSGGPLMLVVGQREAEDKNSASFVKNIKEIIVKAGQINSWNHSTPIYESYLDTTLLRITGSEVANPITFTLRELEQLTDGIIRDTYTSSQDVAQFEGIELKYLINEIVKLKTGINKPSKITIYSGAKYSRNVDVNQVWDGVVNTSGENKKIILSYAREGFPLVANIGDTGYSSNNNGGPIKLIVEENISMWIKWADTIVVGEGEYEKP